MGKTETKDSGMFYQIELSEIEFLVLKAAIEKQCKRVNKVRIANQTLYTLNIALYQLLEHGLYVDLPKREKPTRHKGVGID